MVVVLSLLALGMIATGLASLVFGAPIIQNERGWTMVIAGSVGASSGAVLLGIALAAQRLGRIARETVKLRDRISHIAELSDERAERAALAPVSYPAAVAPPSGPAASLEAPPAASVQAALGPSVPQATVTGQYSSGGNSYTMFSDGSILADLPDGPRRFASLEERRDYVAESA